MVSFLPYFHCETQANQNKGTGIFHWEVQNAVSEGRILHYDALNVLRTIVFF